MPLNQSLYVEHFCRDERPFSLLPDPDILYRTDYHIRSYTMLDHGVTTGAPLTLITGDVGAGMTTLLQHLLKNLQDSVTVGLLFDFHDDRVNLVRWVLMALDVSADKDADHSIDMRFFPLFLIVAYAAIHRISMIFDEAQNMLQKSFEELRVFTISTIRRTSCCSCCLLGR